MHILITGAQGFLGQTTQRLAAASGHDVTATARTNAMNCIPLDLGNTAGLLALLERTNPDVIINCAAQVTFETGTLADQFAVNSLMPSVLAAWCARTKQHLVHVSSAAVAGITCREITGTTPAAPDTDYGQAKCLAENMVMASGASAACIRFGGIFGYPGPPHLGLNKAIAAARDSNIHPTIVGTGKARRNYIHVEDAARILIHCATEKVTGILAAGGRDELTISEIMTRLSDTFFDNEPPTYTDGPEAADQIVLTSAGLPIGGTFEDGLERCR
ncbi:MAG: NAD(P)-dependent oxidoreductase [Rhodospirillales bacterium]